MILMTLTGGLNVHLTPYTWEIEGGQIVFWTCIEQVIHRKRLILKLNDSQMHNYKNRNNR